MSGAQLVLVATVAAPALAAAPIGLLGSRDAASAARLATAAALTAFAGSVALLLLVGFGRPVELLAQSADGRAVAGLAADRMAVVLLLLVAGVLAVVQGYASRYLLGDPRAGRFFALSGLTASAMSAAICAATFTGLVAAWCAASIGLCLMLIHRADLAQSREGALRTARALALGDGALVLAAVVVLASGPDLDLRRIGAAASELTGRSLTLPAVGSISAGVLVASLIAVCALARSAQVPFHRWLAATLAAPTPVSALLHAGLINGAGLLLIRLAPIVGLAPLVVWLVLGAGLATAVLGTAFMLVRADVKGSLAWSTVGQMGFMVAQCATGAFAAALFHMVSHGVYKATLFLGSGSAVAARRRHLEAPAGRPLLTGGPRAAVAALVPAILLVGALAVVAPHLAEQRGTPLLLAFAWASAAQATWGWLGSAGGAGRRAPAVGLTALALACVGYVGAVSLFEGFVAGAMPAVPAAMPSSWIVLAVVGAVAVLYTALRLLARHTPGVAAVEQRAYARLWSAAGSRRPVAATRPRRRVGRWPSAAPEVELAGVPS